MDLKKIHIRFINIQKAWSSENIKKEENKQRNGLGMFKMLVSTLFTFQFIHFRISFYIGYLQIQIQR